jgi:hypothetical protein
MLRRTVTWAALMQGTVTAFDAATYAIAKGGEFKQSPNAAPHAASGRWYEVSRDSSPTVLRRGTDAEGLTLTELAATVVYEWHDTDIRTGEISPPAAPLPPAPSTPV